MNKILPFFKGRILCYGILFLLLEESGGVEVCTLNVLKVTVGANLEFHCCVLVADNDCLAVHLECAEGAHV